MDRNSSSNERKETAAIVNMNNIDGGNFLLIDITIFGSVLKVFFETTDRKIKRKQVEKIVNSREWIEHYSNKRTGRRVLAESQLIEHAHELETAIKLTAMDYDVIFAPKGLFRRNDKKFDVFLLREHILLKADLKKITSKNPDTIARRIREGSEQASRIVIDIRSDISPKDLIDGLRSGNNRNDLLKEILLFYRSRFYLLSRNQILGKNIYTIIK